ncbi:MAG TPA: hypothetical protein VGD01_03715 [Candidatus Elarobacter sp.]|jgi:hypothetical protein
MRKTLTLAAIVALAGCGGSGGGGTAPQQPTPTTAPIQQGSFVTPQFTIRIPARTSSGKDRKPQFVSSHTASVKITLTADSAGIATGSIPPVTTDISPTCGAAGCTATVNGPPSPPGTDSYLVVTYDGAGATGNALNAAQLNGVTVTAGTANSQSITLGAIPAGGTLSVAALPTTWHAGTAGQNANLSISAVDAHGDTIPAGQTPNVLFVDAAGNAVSVTVTDPDTSLHGTCVATSTSSCTSGASTSVTFSGPDVTQKFNYDGLAENPVTLTAAITGATSGTAAFQPILNAPVFNSSKATPAGVALSSSPEIDLFATTLVGSTGTESFTESGWTNAPYNNALTFANTGACTSGAGISATSMSDIAVISVGSNSTTDGTPITATTKTTGGAPKAGSCPSTISDGLGTTTGGSNTTGSSITLTVTYTTLSVTGQSKRRQ